MAPDGKDPAFRRHLKKACLGGQVPAHLAPACGDANHLPGRLDMAETQPGARIRTPMRALVRHPKGARRRATPGPH